MYQVQKHGILFHNILARVQLLCAGYYVQVTIEDIDYDNCINFSPKLLKIHN